MAFEQGSATVFYLRVQKHTTLHVRKRTVWEATRAEGVPRRMPEQPSRSARSPQQEQEQTKDDTSCKHWPLVGPIRQRMPTLCAHMLRLRTSPSSIRSHGKEQQSVSHIRCTPSPYKKSSLCGTGRRVSCG
mmetsp:Transcript_1006/g.1902  ORF Transcript_1006/g.1902 Transcript_1006/m.1902 type:complete len:131 (+) Transcript_1006:53-445(+)